MRSEVWLWGTLLAAALFLLVWLGPFEVLLPYVVKNESAAARGTSASSSLRPVSAPSWPRS